MQDPDRIRLRIGLTHHGQLVAAPHDLNAESFFDLRQIGVIGTT